MMAYLYKGKIMLYKQLVIITLSCTLLACAASGDVDDRAAGAAESRGTDCIMEGTIRDYRVLDDSKLIVSGSGKRKYLLTLNRRATGMRSSWQIGFVSRTGQICPGFGEIVIKDWFGPERIRINSIRQLTAEEHEDLLVRYGKKKPDVEQTRTPEKVEGAEVEELD